MERATSDDLPVVDPDDVPAVEAAGTAAGTEDRDAAAESDPDVAGVLLAAGESERFGEQNKLLASLDGQPLVVHAARTLVAADLDRTVAVLGHEADRVRQRLVDLPVEPVENPDYGAGRATSVRRGVSAVGDADAALFALGDQPRVAPATVDLLVDAFRAGDGDPLAAAHDGQRGNPVLFGAGHFEELAALEGEAGGRDVLLSAENAALVETGDPGVSRDVDTPADLDRLR